MSGFVGQMELRTDVAGFKKRRKLYPEVTHTHVISKVQSIKFKISLRPFTACTDLNLNYYFN